MHLHIFLCHLHTQHENTFLSFLCHPHRITSGLCNPEMHLKKIRKLKKTSELCNPERNHASQKRLPDPEANYKFEK